MKQTILAKQESPLLAYALSKLDPEVFSHPVWLRFGRLDPQDLPATIEELTKISRELERDHLQEACSLLLICAAYQNQSGQYNSALTTLKQVLTLASQSGLTAEILWALWGAGAICFQYEKYDLAADHLEELQTALNEQKEWILAGFMEVIKKCLRQSASEKISGQSGRLDDNSSDELIHRTYLWLQEWGSGFKTPKPASRPWRLHWLMPRFVQRAGKNLQAEMFPAKANFPVWQSIKSLLRLQAYHTNTETQVGLPMHEDSTRTIPGDVSPRIKPPTENLQLSNLTPPELQKKNDRLTVIVQMLGVFSIAIDNQTLKIAPSRGLSMLKYLLLHHRKMTPREVLMDIFWPEAGPEAARNNLNVAIYSLRQVLRSMINQNMICYEDGAYGLASNMDVWLDVEEFHHCVKEGQRQEAGQQLTAAVAEYEIAINLYRGDLLAETPYEEWTVLEREQLRIAYLEMLDRVSQIYFGQERYAVCISACQLILTRDKCREDAHCRLMQCYSRLGQTPLALRQYQICVEALQAELEVAPAHETTKLYENIRRREYI